MKKLINYVLIFLDIGTMFAIYFVLVYYFSKWTGGWSNLVLSILGIALLTYFVKPKKDDQTYLFASYIDINGEIGRCFIICKKGETLNDLEKYVGHKAVILYYRQITRKEYLKQTNESCLTEKQRESKNLNQK